MKSAAPASVLAVLAGLLAGCATLVSSHSEVAPPVLHPLDAALLWHQRAGTAAPPGLAASWGEVCGEHDPAERARAVAGAQQRLAEAGRAAAATTRWIVPIHQALSGYDARRGGFSVNLRTGGVVRFDRSDYCQEPLTYLLAFGNGDAFAFVPVADEAARRFVRSNRERTAELEVTVEPVRAQGGPQAPALVVRIDRVRLKDALTGAVLGDTLGHR